MSSPTLQEPGSAESRPNAIGPDQGVIEEARRRQRRRRTRGAIGAMLVAAGVGGVVLILLGGSSKSLVRDSGSGGHVPFAHARNTGRADFKVQVTPNLAGGFAGWTVLVEERGGFEGGSGGPPPVSSTPLFGGTFANTRTSQSVFTLTTPQVAAVLVPGKARVPTLALPELPYGWRAARIVLAVKARPAPDRPGSTITVPPAPLPPLTLVALDRSGHPIAEGHPSEQAQTPTLYWEYPARPARGACALHARGLSALSPRWGNVATVIRAFPGRIVGRAFLSCIDTEYYLHNWPLDVAILLDAEHPGHPPAPIPNMTGISGAPGFYDARSGFSGELTATRYGPTWLVIEGGSGPGQRIQVLRHLTATVKL